MHRETEPTYRTQYQRDRDRIVHSSAFRRLEYKTQVFVNHEGDLFRTRLTHSMEVAQIARTIARVLGLNEDLVEAIALAHDLGHTPFGHAGQHALDDCMKGRGGFEHNLQSLRVVDRLEEKYAAFPGLNLTYETREGILKHCSKTNARKLGPLGERFLRRGQPSLEAQLADVADTVAYSNHDIDDGLRAGLITIEQLREVNLFSVHHADVCHEWPGLPSKKVAYEVIRRIINQQVSDLIETSQARLTDAAPADIDAVRARANPLIGFSDAMHEAQLELRQFLNANVYQHYRVQRMSRKAQRLLRQLFGAFLEHPGTLPPDARRWMAELEADDPRRGRARAVADYLAGMTDRYAIAEFERIFHPTVLT